MKPKKLVEDETLPGEDAAGADNRSEGPDPVAGKDNGDGLYPDAAPGLAQRLLLQGAHNNQELDRMEDGV